MLKLASPNAGILGIPWIRPPRTRSHRPHASYMINLPMAFLGLVAIGVVEITGVVREAIAVHEGLRAGALDASRHRWPLDRAASIRVENIVKTGDPSGALPHLASGWSKDGAAVQIHELTYDLAGSWVPFVRVGATVPYDFVLARLIPLPTIYLEMFAEQVSVAD